MLERMSSAGFDEPKLRPLDVLWQQVRQQLANEKQRISQEIWEYPRPIPACDAQYNGLLEARSAILHEIGRIDSLLKQTSTLDEQLALLHELANTSPFLQNEIAPTLQQQFSELRAAVVAR